ncbi:ABC transporter ATP-binding protein [Polaribacter sp. P097]|uniref:ABC transporter ATP-binding protein n=1 Tax=Polaribacter sp. P097 TaxID=3117398 RepID=UPI002FE03D54
MLLVNQISFSYSKSKIVLDNFNFTLKQGEHLCVMGESGCGKSTLLKAIYGLLDLNKGNIYWNNEQILGPEFNLVPGFERFKYVAQDFDLMPYISVSENIKKYLSRFYPEESERRTQELLEVIEMKAFENTKVKNLSGGQKQRVAIARALAKEPVLLLLDEPFSQIDNFKKNTLRRNLFTYLKEKNIACIVATHDKNDALSFADFLMVIKNNTILVNNNPEEIYKNPKEKYVASLFDDVNELTINNNKQLLYPHQIKIVDKSDLLAVVTNAYFKGEFWLIEVEHKNQTLFVNHLQSIAKGTTVYLGTKKVT